MRRLKLVGGMLLAAFGLAACSDNLPQSTLNPAGPIALKEEHLYQMVFWIAVAVFFLVEGVLVAFLIKYRHKKGSKSSQLHGNSRLEIAWTIAPVLLLAAVSVPTVAGIWSLAKPPVGNDVINVDVVGHQWWWEFRYPDSKVVTANELYIPVGQPVFIQLCAAGSTGPSNDSGVATGPAVGGPCVNPAPSLGNAVIHSFWVPRLSGKTDVVPGRTNTMSIEASFPGVFPGQCAEFCSWSHANMRFKVVALPADQYQTWLAQQQTDSVVPSSGSLAEKGMQTFAQGACIGCHSIKGVEGAAGIQGPDLTHFASRNCFAGCMFDTNEENLKKWLEDPPAVKPGSWMPNYHLSADEIDALVAYLQTLK